MKPTQGVSPILCLFDWNGTLQDDMHHIYECGVQRIFRHFGLPCPTLDTYRNEVGADFMKTFYWPHGIPAGVTADDLNQIMRAGFKEKGTPAPVFPDALETVRACVGYGHRCMLVSAYDSGKLAEAVERNGFSGLFCHVQGDVRDKAQCFFRLISEVGAMRELAAVIGDTVDDAEAARLVGAAAFICPRGFHTRERIVEAGKTNPHIVVIDTLSDLLPNLR